MRQIRSRLWVSEEGEGLVEPRFQHIHAVVSILDHGIPLFVGPAGVGSGELSDAFGFRSRSFSGSLDSGFGIGSCHHGILQGYLVLRSSSR